ncbi:hypothetical protein [Actinoplanes sp. NPDC026619]|uniref:hypothetical protein n=1 Tax=Actinoplanes sp. NPDC026619 TaxID=3155798 RepID=UPI0033C4DEC4
MSGGFTVDRLAITVPAMSPADARRLAELVGSALGRHRTRLVPARLEMVRVAVPAGDGDLERLAEDVAAAVIAALHTTGVS